MKERIEQLENELAELKKQLEEPEFEVGDWVKDNDENILRITNTHYERKYPNDICVVGYGVWRREQWRGEDHPLYITKSKVSKATPEEIESALIEEAKRRGLTPDKDVNPVVYRIGIHKGDYWYEFYNDVLYCNTIPIYSNGEWSEVEPEQIKFFEWDVEYVAMTNHDSDSLLVEIGCETYPKTFLKDLKKALEYLEDYTVKEVLNELEKLDL